MAGDSTVAVESVVLLDTWPACPIKSLEGGVPTDGFTGADHHNVAAAAYQVGTKAQVYNPGTTSPGVAGFSTFIYLQTKDAITAALELCQPASTTDPHAVSSTLTSAIIVNDISPKMAVSISAMTDEYFGWFWCAGVAPVDFVAAIGTVGDIATDGAVTIGLCTVGAGVSGALGKLELLVANTALTSPVAFCIAADA